MPFILTLLFIYFIFHGEPDIFDHVHKMTMTFVEGAHKQMMEQERKK